MTNSKAKSNGVAIFALASFLHDMGSDIVFSVWPIFVTQVLGANMAILGLIDGIGDGVVSISQAVGGYLSDKLGKRKIFVWLGYLFGGFARIGYALAPTWRWLIPFRILDRSGKFRGSPRDAIVSEISSRENRGRNFGLLRAADNLGAVFGILIAILFLARLGYKNLFFLAAIPSFIASIVLLIFVKEKKTENIFKGIQFRYFTSNLKIYIFSSALFSVGAFSYSFLLIFAKQSGFQAVFVPTFYLLFTLVAALSSLPFGKISDRIGRKYVLYLSFIFWALVLTMFIFWQNYLGIILGFILYGLHKGSLEPVQKSFIAELAPKEFLASTLGGFQMIVGFATLPGSFIAGLLWDKLGSIAPFYFSLFLTLIATLTLLFVKEKNKAS